MKKIPFGGIKINDESKRHVQDCLENNQITMGEKVKLFEEKWKNLFGYSNAVAVNSGTSGVIAACIALYDFDDIKPGDGVICPALTFIASANGIRAAGLKPVFVDVKKTTMNIDVECLEDTIKEASCHVRAILAVNLMGKPCELDIISEIASKYNLKVIVDNCEAYGSRLNGKYALEYADMEISSHYIAHILQCGEMGMVSMESRKLRDAVKSIRNHGREPDSLYFDHIRYGLNLKPMDIIAAIGLGQVENFWSIFNRRKSIIEAYNNALFQYDDKFYFVKEAPNASNAPHGFSFVLKEKYAIIDNITYIKHYLTQAGIEWKRNFQNIPDSDAFKLLGGNSSFWDAQYISDYGLHIGCSDLMTDEDVEYVCDTLSKIFDDIK